MSKLKYDGIPLTDLIEGNVAGRGGYSGPSTNTSSNTSSKPRYTRPGANTGFKISGVDIQLYNYAEYSDYNNSSHFNAPSWCNHVTYSLRGGGGGGGAACGYAITGAYNWIAYTAARNGGFGGNGQIKQGVFNTQNTKNCYIGIGAGGSGGNSGNNSFGAWGNSTVIGYPNGADGNSTLGNDANHGGSSYIDRGNGRIITAEGGHRGNRAVPGQVRRHNYGRSTNILRHSAWGNNGGTPGNQVYDTNNYGGVAGGAGGNWGEGRNYMGVRHWHNDTNGTNVDEHWPHGYYNQARFSNGVWHNNRGHYQPTNAGNGGNGWGRVFFRIGNA